MLAATLTACATAAPPPGAPAPAPAATVVPPKAELRVALFPYIPDVTRDSFQAFQARLEQEFESAHPEIDLQLRPMNTNDNDFYDTAAVRGWLANGTYDVVEVDAIMLGDLAAAGVLTPRSAVDSTNWHPGLTPALSYGGVIYGIPHWLCGDFILSRITDVTNATSSTAISQALAAAPANQVKLSGALGGSWTLPALYLHAYADSHGPAGLAGAISPEIDSTAVQQMRTLLKFCVGNGVNTCLNGTAYPPDSSVEMYATGRSDAFLGFSERLTAIAMAGGDLSQVRLSPAPLGNDAAGGNLPVLYVDALVRRQNCDSACRDHASSFEQYLLSDSTYQWMLTSADAPQAKRIARYLLPATVSAFNVEGVAGDFHFRDMRAAVTGGVPLPNRNFASTRKSMQAALLPLLTQ
ncbi:MAG TPA: hypothetical protein VF541_03730 [Longimicrobium sp.]